MYDPVERCARDVLRSEAALTIPLSRLHRALVAEAGAAAGTYGQLRERLRRSPDRYELVEPPGLPWSVDGWPEATRHAYQAELHRVGVVAEPRVVLRGTSPPPSEVGAGLSPVLRRLDATLLELWSAVDARSADRARVAEAMARVDELRTAAVRVGSGPG